MGKCGCFELADGTVPEHFVDCALKKTDDVPTTLPNLIFRIEGGALMYATSLEDAALKLRDYFAAVAGRPVGPDPDWKHVFAEGLVTITLDPLSLPGQTVEDLHAARQKFLFNRSD